MGSKIAVVGSSNTDMIIKMERISQAGRNHPRRRIHNCRRRKGR